jgi:hypothetical protein
MAPVEDERQRLRELLTDEIRRLFGAGSGVVVVPVVVVPVVVPVVRRPAAPTPPGRTTEANAPAAAQASARTA